MTQLNESEANVVPAPEAGRAAVLWQRSVSLWSRARPILALGGICCLAELSYAIVNVLAVPAYVAKELPLGAYVGIIMGAFLLAEAVGRLGFGALSDVVGRKPLIIGGPLLSGAAAILVARMANPLPLMLVRVVDGLGAAAFWPAIFAAVGDSTSTRNRSAGMGLLNVAYMIGLAFGPLAGGWINDRAGSPGHPVYHAAFYLAAGLFAATSLLALLFVPRRAFAGSARSSAGEFEERFTGLSSMASAAARVWRLLVVAFTTFLAIGLLIPVVELYALDKYGINQETFGSLFLIPAVIIGLTALPLGRLGDRWGRLTSIRVGMLLCAASLWAVPGVQSPYILAAGAVVVGVGFLLAFPAWMALLSDATSATLRGSVLGAAGMAQGFGAITGAVLGGKMYHLGAPVLGIAAHDSPIYLAASLLALSFVLAVTLLAGFKTGSISHS